MCTNVLKLAIMDGKHRIGERSVPCRKCEECRKQRVRNWVGRINAEMQTSDKIDFVTLTYADGNGDHHERLVYKDVQKMFYRLRKAGYKFKYIVVGEYGEQKGRAHWHVIFMWKGKWPDVERKPAGSTEDARIHWEFWSDPKTKIPIGFVQFDVPRSLQGTAAYIMKYLTKNDNDEMRFSEQIGHEYIEKRAREKARAGQRLFKYNQNTDTEMLTYTVDGNTAQDGSMYWYNVERGSALHQKMVISYLEEWAVLRPDQLLPPQYEAIEALQELMQYNFKNHARYIRYCPQLAIYAERHYGYTKGVFGPVAQTDVVERIVEKWQRDAEDREILPNQVQIDMYRQVARNRANEVTPSPMPTKRSDRRKRLQTGPLPDDQR